MNIECNLSTWVRATRNRLDARTPHVEIHHDGVDSPTTHLRSRGQTQRVDHGLMRVGSDADIDHAGTRLKTPSSAIAGPHRLHVETKDLQR
jgi:hypothetical protein